MPEITPDRARELIRAHTPLAADDIKLLGHGTDSAAFRVDRDWVVRFPLVAEAQRTLRLELALLPMLAPSLPVAVPHPEHVGQDAAGRLIFSAYRAIDGEPLSDATLRALPARARERALDELSALLAAIHGFPLTRARAAGVSFELYKGAYHDQQDTLLDDLDRLLTAADRAAIKRQRTAFARAAREQPQTPVLLHADIKPAHLLHDPVTGALTGLIDWGDASLGHPDFDLAIIGAFCGPETIEHLLARRPATHAARAREILPFLLTVRWLQDLALVSAAETDTDTGGDPELTASALARLQDHLRG
jgi:aminoglycoside 2''-phosphotransferase